MKTQTLKTIKTNGTTYTLSTEYTDGVVSCWAMKVIPSKNRQFWSSLGVEELR